MATKSQEKKMVNIGEILPRLYCTIPQEEEATIPNFIKFLKEFQKLPETKYMMMLKAGYFKEHVRKVYTGRAILTYHLKGMEFLKKEIKKAEIEATAFWLKHVNYYVNNY